MGPRPVGKGIGAEARVDQGQGGFDLGVLQVLEIRKDLVAIEHALVDKRFARQAGDVKHVALRDVGVPHEALRQLADHIELAFKTQRVAEIQRLRAGSLANEYLPDKRLALARRGTDERVIGGNGAPAEKLLVFIANDFFNNVLAAQAVLRILGKKNQTGTILAERGQMEAELGRFLLNKSVGHLKEDARAVTGIGLATTSAAVLQVKQDLQGVLDDFVGLAILQIGDKTHAAGVMFVRRIIKSLRAGFDVRHGRPHSLCGFGWRSCPLEWCPRGIMANRSTGVR